MEEGNEDASPDTSLMLGRQYDDAQMGAYLMTDRYG